MTRLPIFLVGLMAVGSAACASSPDSPHTAVAIGATSIPPTGVSVAPASPRSSPPSSTASATPAPPPDTYGRGDAIGAPVGGKPDRDAVGAPVGGKPAAPAAGSPFRMPPITQLQGFPMTLARTVMEQRLIEACGTPTPCVTITERVGDNDFFTRCQLDRIEPGEGDLVERGSVVYLVTGTATPCEEPPSDDPPPDEPPPTTVGPTTTTVGPATTRPATTSTITAP